MLLAQVTLLQVAFGSDHRHLGYSLVWACRKRPTPGPNGKQAKVACDAADEGDDLGERQVH
jgi:hypothetical protein